MKKLLPWIALAVALFWILGNPAGAAATIHQLFTAIGTFATRL